MSKPQRRRIRKLGKARASVVVRDGDYYYGTPFFLLYPLSLSVPASTALRTRAEFDALRALCHQGQIRVAAAGNAERE